MSLRPIEEIVEGLQTKSDKIRALTAAGYKRSAIASYLGIRYQHVRNVEVQDRNRAGLNKPDGDDAGPRLAEADERPTAPASIEMITHSFSLRRDATITLSLPSDITIKEAERMCSFLRALPF